MTNQFCKVRVIRQHRIPDPFTILTENGYIYRYGQNIVVSEDLAIRIADAVKAKQAKQPPIEKFILEMDPRTLLWVAEGMAQAGIRGTQVEDYVDFIYNGSGDFVRVKLREDA